MKQYITSTVIIIVAGLLGVACAKLSIYQSEFKTSLAEAPVEHMNSESKLIYTVAHDAENLYLKISTSDITTQGSILKKGLTVWADQKVKKNETLGFTYPIVSRSQTNPPELQKGNRAERGSMEDSSKESQKLFKYYEKLPKQIKLIGFESPGKVQLANSSLDASPVDIIISMSETGRLSYRATIPLQFIFSDGDFSNEQMSIGIKIAAPILGQGRPSGQGVARDGGGHRQGGGRQGGGSRGGGGSRPSSNASNNASTSASPIEFWFQVNLNESVQ